MTLAKATGCGALSLTKPEISAGVGGRPMRSKVARRISVWRSASATGRNFFASRPARMYWSIGSRPHVWSVVAGGEVFFGTWNAQNCRPFCRSILLSGAFVEGIPSRGSGAPIFTQYFSASISASESLYFGGIWRSGSAWPIALMRRLFSGLPGSITSPESPPSIQPASVSRASPPLVFALEEWHS